MRKTIAVVFLVAVLSRSLRVCAYSMYYMSDRCGA